MPRLPWEPQLPAVVHTRPVVGLANPVATFCDNASEAAVANVLRIACADAEPEPLSSAFSLLNPVKPEPFAEGHVSERNTRLAVEACRVVFMLLITHEHGLALERSAINDYTPALVRGRMIAAGADAALRVLFNGEPGVFVLLTALVSPVQFMRLNAVAPKINLLARVQELASRLGTGDVPEPPEPVAATVLPPRRKRRKDC